MAHINRPTLLRSAPDVGLGGLLLRSAGSPLRIGVTDWNLRLGAKTEAVPLAAQLGFDGVQVSFGRRFTGDKLPVDDPAIVDRYLQLSAQHKIPIDGTC